MENDTTEHPDCMHCGAKEITDNFDGFGTYQYACGYMFTRDHKVLKPCPTDSEWQ